MSLAKIAQFSNDELMVDEDDMESDLFDTIYADENDSDDEDSDEDSSERSISLELDGDIEDDEISGEGLLTISEGDDEVSKEFDFALPLVPGGLSQEQIDVSESDDEIEVEEEEVSKDPWDWKAHSKPGFTKFKEWLIQMLNNVPKHSGYDSTGIERATSYMERLNGIISRAVREDHNGELNISHIEKIRNEIIDGIDRLKDRLESLNKHKRKKKAVEEEDGLIKNAQKISGVHGTVVTVDLLLSHIARVCINGTVSGGKDMEDTFEKMAKKYDLTLREKFVVIQLLEDMGWYIKPREFDMDKKFDPTSEDNAELPPNYQA